MQVSAKGVVRAALVSFCLSMLLIVLLAVTANGLGAAGISVSVVQAVGLLLGVLARCYAGLMGGRVARRAGFGVREVALTAALGCALGFVVLQLLNSFTEVVLLARELTLSWSMLYGVLPWLAEGAVGGLLATRIRAKSGSRRPARR